ncbi:MAG: SDR family oxidoreductase [Rhodocyclaceae bacterium]|jgi:nucleoside-diphosphate-sugar epimerase|nr:SDR family oxidoreductase [Rhodocyclaceae bacterium]
MKKTILIIGCGDVARRAVPWLARRFRVLAVIRDPADGPALRALGAKPLVADLDRPASLARLAGLADWVIHAAPPPSQGDLDPRTRRLLAALERRSTLPQALAYISTTGVYGDCGGAWVSESRPVRPNSGRARRRVDAEGALRAFGRRTGCRVSILRAPGIYAADRLSLERLRRGDPVLNRDEDVFTNHIHAEDLARIACLALFRGRPGRCYNASDDTELPMGEYFDLMADCFGLPRPPRMSRTEIRAHLSPATLSFMAESRRLSNHRLKAELRLRLGFPTVGEGLAAARQTLA